LRINQKILEPLRMIGPTTVRRDHNQGTIVLEVQERDRMFPTGAGTDRGEQHHVVSDESTAESSPGQSE
jgi:hypothetical protein